jgi:methionine-rich copper-binding protein CopC
MGSAVRCLVVVTAGVAVALSICAPAFGHADLEETMPSANSRVAKPPREVKLVLAEPPGPGSTLQVKDGCRANVVEDVVTNEGESILSAALGRGEPGQWRVRFQSISAVDGHLVKGAFKFTVAGKHACGGSKKNSGAQGSNRQGPQAGDQRGDSDDSEGSSLPVVPLALGTAALVGVALIARRSTL